MQPPVSAKRPIIFSLHGIRTGGAWQKADLTRVLSEAGFDHLALDFGFFRALRLLRPAVRRRQVDWFRDRYTAEMRGQSSLPSIIAHSFGTYIVAEAMRIYPEVRFNQVILCGSIVQQDFPWSNLIDEGRVRRVLNDCGQRDFWAGIVVWAVDDAGPSGVKGFSDTARGLVIQRSHPDWRHSDFFYELNYQRNWIPFLQGSMPGPPGTAAGRTTNWRFRLAVLMCLALLATLGSILYPRLVPEPPLPRRVWPEKFPEAYAQAIKSYERGELPQARELFLPLAEDGNRDAQYYMGRIIDELSHNSPKVSEKLSEAKSWFEKAANQGHRESMYYMGYILGEKEKRSAEAIPWFERACALQYEEACRLASFHRKKLGG